MTTVELTNQQVIDLVRQLSPQQKREVLLALAGDAANNPSPRMRLAEHRLRQLATDRGLDWDAMRDDDREALVDKLIHENRPCAW